VPNPGTRAEDTPTFRQGIGVSPSLSLDGYSPAGLKPFQPPRLPISLAESRVSSFPMVPGVSNAPNLNAAPARGVSHSRSKNAGRLPARSRRQARGWLDIAAQNRLHWSLQRNSFAFQNEEPCEGLYMKTMLKSVMLARSIPAVFARQPDPAAKGESSPRKE